MNWGDPIRCHTNESLYARDEFMAWLNPDPEGSRVGKPTGYPPLPHGVLGHPYGYPFRTCGYCGSIHPEDLYICLNHPRASCLVCDTHLHATPEEQRAVAAQLERHTCGVRLNGADWKYGWPHKFYVEGIPNPIAGRLVISSTHYKDGVTSYGEPHPASDFTHAKFYNVHLKDLDVDAFALLAPLLQTHGGIQFIQEGDRLKYRAPYHGYQHST